MHFIFYFRRFAVVNGEKSFTERKRIFAYFLDVSFLGNELLYPDNKVKWIGSTFFCFICFVPSRIWSKTVAALSMVAKMSMSEYKQCPNGHYYQGDHCPYCKSGSNASGNATSMKTEVFGNQNQETLRPTDSKGGVSETEKTTIIEDATIVTRRGTSGGGATGGSPMGGSRTVFGDEDELETVSTPTGEERVQRVYREARKIVGWLVSYTLDPLGVDFKLYEGRNIIGRDIDCNITINDNMVSSKHAVLLFRAGKYSITDSQSSHGTFVNGEDIELEPRYLKDGDVIKIGQTVLKFRTSF